MSRFDDEVTPTTPRLIVRYKVEGNKEMFEWGTHGAIPVLDIVSEIIHIQNRLSQKLIWLTRRMLETEMRNCSEPGLVITFDPSNRTFDWFINDKIPLPPMVGYLELVKLAMLATPTAARMAANQVILGIDGKPIRK